MNRRAWQAFVVLVTGVAVAACVGDSTVVTDAGPDVDPTGTIGHACFTNGTCDQSLTCISGVCVFLDSGTDSAGDVVVTDAPKDSSNTVSCNTYCTDIMSNCLAGNLQYNSVADCTIACTFMPVGIYAQPGNTVGCRQFQATQQPAPTTCPFAGPFGATPQSGFCVTGSGICDEFCQIAVGQCPSAYSSLANCKNLCGAYVVQTGQPFGVLAPVSGDTLNCRTYHLMAALSNPSVHCAHIGQISPTCGGGG
jgi:hypothetical protein